MIRFPRMISAVMVVIAVGVSAVTLQDQAAIAELEQKRELLKTEVDQLENDVDNLNRLVEQPIDDEYVAKIANEKFGLYFPDTIIFYSFRRIPRLIL